MWRPLSASSATMASLRRVARRVRTASVVGSASCRAAAHPQRRRMLSTAAAAVRPPGVVPPPATTGELVELLDVTESTEHGQDVFVGAGTDPGWGRLFGGQLMAQALAAAQKSADNALATSMHCYFIRPGSIDSPVEYHVDRLRDGRSVRLRYVRVVQSGKLLCSFSAAFDTSTFVVRSYDGSSDPAPMDHAAPMPDARPLPDDAISTREYIDSLGDAVSPLIRHLQSHPNPLEIRPSRHFHPSKPERAPPDKFLWVRLKQPLPAVVAASADVAVHQQRLLLYLSDYGLVSTALQPHGEVVFSGRLQVASLDHAMHFHRRFDDMDLATEWLLHSTVSPNAAGGRGFVQGAVYRHATGELLATTAQEGIARWRETRWTAMDKS